MFDKNGDGSVSIEEIKEIIGPGLADDDAWADIIAQADADGNGEIDIHEFKAMMAAI
jgi:Ca2+-binding EF-hand superfamily protein